MSTKRFSNRPMTMSQIIRRARKTLRETPGDRKLDMMVEIGILTPEQAARGKQRLLELAEEARTKAEAESVTTSTVDEV